jgi:hypothetical protein
VIGGTDRPRRAGGCARGWPTAEGHPRVTSSSPSRPAPTATPRCQASRCVRLGHASYGYRRSRSGRAALMPPTAMSGCQARDVALWAAVRTGMPGRHWDRGSTVQTGHASGSHVWCQAADVSVRGVADVGRTLRGERLRGRAVPCLGTKTWPFGAWVVRRRHVRHRVPDGALPATSETRYGTGLCRPRLRPGTGRGFGGHV